MPTAEATPWPSDPVATSTQGSTGRGWPSSRLPGLACVSSSASSIAPIALSQAYWSVEAWPFDSTNRSFPGWAGSATS
jgi:hypothetical protein